MSLQAAPAGIKMAEGPGYLRPELPEDRNASSQEEALSSYDAMISEMDAAGLAEVEAFFTKEYQEK